MPVFLLLALFLLVAPLSVLAQDQPTPPAEPSDVISVDAILASLYDVISGPAGQARDWDRLRSLMHPDARLMPIRTNAEGAAQVLSLTVDGYIDSSGSYLVENGFFEQEISRKVDRFGNLVQVFSTYHARHKASDPEPFLRGINSIQLAYQDNRWWILNIAWQAEMPGLSIPEVYLSK